MLWIESRDWDIAPLIRQDDPAAQQRTRVAAGGTLVRRYALH
jgi:hypothetical protein